ncbi:MAG: AAA family ATPase [Bacteroides sp.]|nr:AAA family ATPase [Bacteroides sp.]
MEQQRRLYPIGLQDFKEIRTMNGLYIDKTEYVYRMTHTLGKYYFLSRPRRFGKTLLVSTLQYYFEGHRELFKGLAIDALETEWTQYPVLRFDMSTAKHVDKKDLILEIEGKLCDYEEIYGRKAGAVNINQRLEGLIKAAYKQTGKRVVVLVDEYDAPLLDTVHEGDALKELRQVMRNFYSPLKASDPYLRFVFLTGITKFSQLSIFSELNNIDNISMLKDYAAICGISKEELIGQMATDIDMLAQSIGLSHDETLAKLIENYDGYHFTWPSPDIFNPYSLLKAFNNKELKNYWFETGTPTYLIEMLRRFDVPPSRIGQIEASESSFNVPTEGLANYIPLFYQSGYLTIKGYSPLSGNYLLDMPNKEVRVGLAENLIENYLKACGMMSTWIGNVAACVLTDDMDAALRLIQKILGTVPYCDNANSEGHYQQMLYVMFTMLGAHADVEVHTPIGRVDMVLRTKTRLYVVELKLNKDAETAMEQINLKDYPSRFALCGLPIVKVGINFDSQQRNISDWVIEE